jgi:hypothetical protein
MGGGKQAGGFKASPGCERLVQLRQKSTGMVFCLRKGQRRKDTKCGEFEVPIIMAASSFRNFKFKTALET